MMLSFKLYPYYSTYARQLPELFLRIEISQQYNRYLSKNIATHRYVRDWSPVKVSWDRMLSGL